MCVVFFLGVGGVPEMFLPLVLGVINAMTFTAEKPKQARCGFRN